jgi:hypothetical protein
MEDQLQMRTTVQEVPGLQQIYIATRHWLNDMLFFDDEVRFLKLLLDKYFIFSLNDDNVNRIQLINEHLKRVNIYKQIIRDEMTTHQANLDRTITTNTENRETFLNMEHERLEDEIKDLGRRFKEVKSEIFSITELLLRNDKQHQLVN